jgi:hypothetical protein
MIPGTDLRWNTLVNPATVATNSTASARVDLNDLGTPGVLILHAKAPVATATNASNKWTLLKFSAGDTTTFASSVTVSGLVGTTNTTAASGEFVLPGHNNTSLAQDIVITVRNPGRYGRYWFVQYQGTTSFNTVTIDAIGADSTEAPGSATEIVNVGGTSVSI